MEILTKKITKKLLKRREAESHEYQYWGKGKQTR